MKMTFTKTCIKVCTKLVKKINPIRIMKDMKEKKGRKLLLKNERKLKEKEVNVEKSEDEVDEVGEERNEKKSKKEEKKESLKEKKETKLSFKKLLFLKEKKGRKSFLKEEKKEKKLFLKKEVVVNKDKREKLKSCLKKRVVEEYGEKEEYFNNCNYEEIKKLPYVEDRVFFLKKSINDEVLFDDIVIIDPNQKECWLSLREGMWKEYWGGKKV
ncbi:hypothetical protein Glove_217g245 [Diversispora epigaea]|uniref:Uncharacterized protein n=1 Tax=Diversispora epigaea TaxID=1348612 RepID=A0A397IJM1_9GLOM|nr:hypothetical protein Glove_217g245 [Diversispora epigaea]